MPSELFHQTADSIRSSYQDAQEIDRIQQRFQNREPIYWPENFDAQGRHRIGTKEDWAVCENCGNYAVVGYYYGGAAVTKDGQVELLPQLPLCRTCMREVCE